MTTREQEIILGRIVEREIEFNAAYGAIRATPSGEHPGVVEVESGDMGTLYALLSGDELIMAEYLPYAGGGSR